MTIAQSYYLGYDGGCIKFPIPEEYRHLYQNKTDLPLEFPVRPVALRCRHCTVAISLIILVARMEPRQQQLG